MAAWAGSGLRNALRKGKGTWLRCLKQAQWLGGQRRIHPRWALRGGDVSRASYPHLPNPPPKIKARF